jgi:hypothetical protein
MDPIGFGFENYDTVGRFRSTEGGKAIDASGKLSGSDVDGTFDGVVALADRLTTSADVSACYARQWFRYGYGRSDTEDDMCVLEGLGASFVESGGSVQELLIALTQTDAFLFRPAGGAP